MFGGRNLLEEQGRKSDLKYRNIRREISQSNKPVILSHVSSYSSSDQSDKTDYYHNPETTYTYDPNIDVANLRNPKTLFQEFGKFDITDKYLNDIRIRLENGGDKYFSIQLTYKLANLYEAVCKHRKCISNNALCNLYLSLMRTFKDVDKGIPSLEATRVSDFTNAIILIENTICRCAEYADNIPRLSPRDHLPVFLQTIKDLYSYILNYFNGRVKIYDIFIREALVTIYPELKDLYEYGEYTGSSQKHKNVTEFYNTLLKSDLEDENQLNNVLGKL